MARPKRYEDAAARQREYRRRKYLATLTPELRRIQRAEHQHRWISFRALNGDPVAAQIAGADYYQTAINLLAYLDDYCLHWAHEEALRRLGVDKASDVKSE
jgi:hypothetical protein